MTVSHTGTYWQSHLQELCNSKRLAKPTYEVFEHSGGTVPLDSSCAGGCTTPSHTGQAWYSCVVSVGGKDYETSYVYKAEENARERAAKKAYEALGS